MDLNLQATPLFKNLESSDTRITINYGGAGSSKSYTQGQFLIIKGFKRRIRTLILRKTKEKLRDSVIELLVYEILPSLGIGQYFQFHKTERILTNLLTGSEYLFRGLDDPEKIKSISGITDIWIEEASEFNEEDVNQLNTRLRNSDEDRIYLTFNPIDENHWLKAKYFDREDPDVTIFKSTYLQNKFLPPSYVKELLKFKETDYDYYRVYALGDWGKLDTGGEVYKGFKPEIHVKDLEYDPSLPLHLSFDENVNPYLTCLIIQGEDRSVRVIDEITLKSPQNNLAFTLTEFKRRYPNHKEGVFFYGDATSKKEDTKLEKGRNFYTLIREGLIEYNPVNRVPSSNPSVFTRTLFIDSIFRGIVEGPQILISPRARNTVEDLKYVKQASDGSKLKEKKKDPKTGVPYEPYGHTSDALEYFVCVFLSSDYYSFQRGSDKEVNYSQGKRRQRGTY